MTGSAKQPPESQKEHDLRRKQLGKRGEDIACSYLLKHGYTICDRNFTARPGELDIIAIQPHITVKAPNTYLLPMNLDGVRTGPTLVFVEVKTRLNKQYGLPEESVTPWKLREVIKTSQYYALTHDGLPERQRIDVIGIILDIEGHVTYFNHIENVTE